MSAILWAHMTVGHSTGTFFSDSGRWEDHGFTVDDDGNPISDVRGNTVGNYSAEAFDPEDNDHVRVAVDYATSDGDTDRENLESYLIGELGISPEKFEEHLGEWLREQTA